MAITMKLRFWVLARDGYRCRYCGRDSSQVVLHVDHRMPKSRGGTDDPENLCASCFDCNMGKSARIFEGTTQVSIGDSGLIVPVAVGAYAPPMQCSTCGSRIHVGETMGVGSYGKLCFDCALFVEWKIKEKKNADAKTAGK